MRELGQMSLDIPALALTLTWAEVEKLSHTSFVSLCKMRPPLWTSVSSKDGAGEA